tara:strand:- start:14 stop:121 length:108 start_codon:yes stop_codon:yes gene_type:complete
VNVITATVITATVITATVIVVNAKAVKYYIKLLKI